MAPRRATAALVTVAVATAGSTALALSPAGAVDSHTSQTDGCVASVPEPGTAAPVEICYTLFRPVGASATRKVPVVMHSHGWGGERERDPAAFSSHLDNGLGVMSPDNLVPLRQGLTNWDQALTDAARRRGIFVGYNGGHTLPSAVPFGSGPVAADPCSQRLGSADFADLALRFMQQNLQGTERDLQGFNRFHLATADGRCTTVGPVLPDRTVPLADITTPTVAGPAQAVPVTDGPMPSPGARSSLRR